MADPQAPAGFDLSAAPAGVRAPPSGFDLDAPPSSPEPSFVTRVVEDTFTLGQASMLREYRKNLDAIERGPQQEATSFTDALDAGMQMSVSGLMQRGRAPHMVLSPKASWASSMAYKASETTGDLPAMLAGALFGTGAGVESGPGAAMTATAGAFALPTAMRETLMDGYENGDFKNFGDFWRRATPILLHTMRDYTTGLLTGGAGKAASAALPVAVSPALRAATVGASELATMTTAGAVLNGQVPTAQDFLDNAILLAGFHAATGVAGKLRGIYKQTGVPPDAVNADAQGDVTIAQDLLSSNQQMPQSYAAVLGKMAPKEEAAPAAPTPAEPPAAGSVEEAQQKILDQVSVGESRGNKLPTLDQVYTNTIDELHPLKKPSGDLPTEENPYQLARLTRGLAGKAEHMIDYGTFDFHTYENNGPSLRSVLDPVKGDIDGFRAYAVAMRAQELQGRGIETGVDPDAVAKVTAAGAGKYQKAFQGLVDYQNRVAAYARDAGVLSKEGYATMTEANKNFVPFYRVMDEGAVGKNATGASAPFRQIRGSERTIIDPIESAVKNTYAITALAERNALNKSVADLGPSVAEKVSPRIKATTVEEAEMQTFLGEHGITDVPDDLLTVFRASRTPLEADQFRVFEDGKPTTYSTDPDIATALGNGLRRDTVGWVWKLLSFPASLVRAGATLTPEFAARHLFRDSIYAFITSEKTMTPWDVAKGFAGLVSKDADYRNWLKSGGSNISMVTLERRYMQESLRSLTADTGLMSRSWNVISHPMDAMRALTEFSENASHLGAYKKYIRENPDKAAIQQAGFESRAVSVDTARIGAKTRAFNAISAFANVTLQDSDRIVRSFLDKPVATALKIGLSVSMPSALLWWANKDDQRVQQLPEWERDLFWIIPTDKWESIKPEDAAGVPPYLLRGEGDKMQINNGHIFRLPKPFGTGVVFGSGVEHLLDAFAGNSANPGGFLKSVMDSTTPSFVPAIATPVVDQFANRSSFTGSSIVPAYAEKMLPEYQYTPYTTEAAKALGQLVGSFPGLQKEAASDSNPIFGGTARALSSPALIESYIHAWTGGLGTYALQLGDLMGRKSGALADPVRAEGTLADIPVVKAFVARYPNASAQSIQDFYDTYNEQKVVYDTWTARAKAGDPQGMARVAAVDPTAFGKLDAISKVLGEHEKLIRDVNDQQAEENPTPEQRAQEASDKRQIIDRLYYNMIEMAKEGNAINAQVAKSLGPSVEK